MAGHGYERDNEISPVDDAIAVSSEFESEQPIPDQVIRSVAIFIKKTTFFGSI